MDLSQASPQTSQFNRLIDLVTEHEAHYREQDVKIAELFHKLSSLNDKIADRVDLDNQPCEGSATPTSAEFDFKDELSSIKLALEKMNKTVLLLSQENEVTRKRQSEFMDSVQQELREVSSSVQSDCSFALKEVESMKVSTRDTYKHLKHQCKSFILENLGVEDTHRSLHKIEDWVKSEMTQLQSTLEKSSEERFGKHKDELDKMQGRIDGICHNNDDIKSKVKRLLEDQATSLSTSKKMEEKLQCLSKEALSVKESIHTLQKGSSIIRSDLVKTHQYSIDRSKDLRHLAKKFNQYLHSKQSPQEDTHNASGNPLRSSSSLYNSWRSTIFTYSPQANKENQKLEEFDTFVRKLKQRLRESEKNATNELDLLQKTTYSSSSHQGEENLKAGRLSLKAEL